MNFALAARTVGRFIKSNAPIILTGLGVTGVGATAVMAAKESKKDEPNYTATAIVGGLTVVCIVGGAVMQVTRTKEVAIAFNNLANRMGNYKKAAEELGAAAVIDKVSKMEVENPEEMEHILNDEKGITGHERYEEALHWFWDEYSNTWFKGTWKQVYYANMMLQQELNETGYAPIGIYYDCLDLPYADECPDNLGFDIEYLLTECECGFIPFDYDEATAPNGDPGFAIQWPIEPVMDIYG